MFSSRAILLDVLRTRLFAYSRVVSSKSIILSPSTATVRENELRLPTPKIAARKLCTQNNPDYVEQSDANLRSKINLTKQIMVRGKAATNYQEELINNFLASHEVATPSEWHELVTNVFNLEFGMINSINIDGKIVDSCVHISKLDLARSYLTYMKSQKKKFNGAVVTSFIKVCYACRDSITEQDKTRIKQFIDFLQKRYSVADSIVCEGLVKGFVLQRRIDEALEVIKKNESLCSLNSNTYSAAAIGLLEVRQLDRGVDFIRESLEKVASLSDEVYLKWIEKYSDSRDELERLLSLFQLYYIKPSKLMCDHLLVAFQSFPKEEKLIGSYGIVNSRGVCSVCNSSLQLLELERGEFEDLRVNFLNNVLVGEDIFKNTTPQELDKFFRLVQSEAPFDVIIDGLNVAYMIGTKTSPATFVNLIQHVLTHFREQNMKILLIGRQHMKRWPNFTDMLKKNQAHYFLIHDLSEDDPFMLYATMYCGIGTNFVTRDLLRTEKFRLHSEKYASLFKRWQQAHQIFISYISPSGRVYARNPMNFQMNVQRSKLGGWHIPYLEDGESTEEYSLHKKWFCLHNPTGEETLS